MPERPFAVPFPLQPDWSAAGESGRRGHVVYIHDATGNVICVYLLKNDTLSVTERYMYGSKRLGMLGQQVWIVAGGTAGMSDSSTIGARTYELTDHLGNVTATILDRKRPVLNSYGNMVYIPLIVSYTDYYPFGYPISDRSYYNGGYRYFFNGQEADNEVFGEGVSLTAEFWQYDTRLGRRWNVDPVFKEYESPYACFAGNPMRFADPKGDTVIVYNNDRVTKKYIKRYFKEHFGSSKMFCFSSNGMLLVKQKEFDLFFDNANPQQQMLLSGLVEAISTTTKVRVLITKTNPNVCFSRQPIVGYDDNGNPTYGEKEQSFIYTQYNGGGAISRDPKFGYIIGICDKVANETLCSSELNIFGVPHNEVLYNIETGSASSAFFHELLDEFLDYYVKRIITPESLPTEEVQYQNAALENKKLPKRDGKDHERL